MSCVRLEQVSEMSILVSILCSGLCFVGLAVRHCLARVPGLLSSPL